MSQEKARIGVIGVACLAPTLHAEWQLGAPHSDPLSVPRELDAEWLPPVECCYSAARMAEYYRTT